MVPRFGLDPHAEAAFLRNLNEAVFRSDRIFQHERPVVFIKSLAAFLDPHVGGRSSEMRGRVEQQRTACRMRRDGQFLGIGADYCRFGLGDSMGLAASIEKRFRGLDSPGKLKLATAGCPRNCSEALIKDVGAVAIGEDKWEIYIGGAGGSHVRKGDVLCIVDNEDDVLLYTGRFIQLDRKSTRLNSSHGGISRMPSAA